MDMDKFCDTEIVIPPGLADILKRFAQDAVTTQPSELLQWSGSYFRALAQGQSLPVKDKGKAEDKSLRKN